MTDDARGAKEPVVAAVSREMIRVYKDLFGRGPTRVRTHWLDEDTIVVVLEDTLTLAERNLVRLDEHQRLRETRMFFQYASVDEFCNAVEQVTGRRVRAFVSGMDSEIDGLSVETFVLHPVGSDAPSRGKRLTDGYAAT